MDNLVLGRYALKQFILAPFDDEEMLCVSRLLCIFLLFMLARLCLHVYVV